MLQARTSSGFYPFFSRGTGRAGGIKWSKNARLARLSIPFSAGQRLKDLLSDNNLLNKTSTGFYPFFSRAKT